jgi:peptidyl-prolyl cis-trans isomerase C
MRLASRQGPIEDPEPVADSLRYHLLRAALAAGKPNLGSLSAAELSALEPKAQASHALESLVLSSPEAAKILIPESRIEQALAEVRGRYDSRADFLADLSGNGLDEQQLRSALQRELIFDGLMQRIGARRPAVTEVDERLFFEMHQERFTQPEQRTARHILITINNDYAENSRGAARARIDAIAAQLAAQPADQPSTFADLARRHSECPTAMQDGQLGSVQRGQLFPALDQALFQLAAGALSAPVESDLGFHILWCERIQPARAIPFAQARERIRQVLEERAARQCQREWINERQQQARQGATDAAST